MLRLHKELDDDRLKDVEDTLFITELSEEGSELVLEQLVAAEAEDSEDLEVCAYPVKLLQALSTTVGVKCSSEEDEEVSLRAATSEGGAWLVLPYPLSNLASEARV